MKRWQILNAFILARKFSSYLELGVRQSRDNFDRIQCRHKVGVDPAPLAVSPQIRVCSSDDYFQNHHETFDLIFIDGFHEEQQAARDIANSLTRLNPNGVVMIHDALPPTAWHQRPPSEYHGGDWNGTVWKAVLSSFASINYHSYVINADWGCAIIDTANPRRHLLGPLNSPLVYERNFVLLQQFIVSPATFVTQNYAELPAPTNPHAGPTIELKTPRTDANAQQRVVYGSPYSLSKNLGQAYNEFMRLLPNDTDFACLADADAMFTISNYGHLIDGVINTYPECRLFYAKTQRIACYWQRDETVQGDDMVLHRAHGKALAEKYGASCVPAGNQPPGSGFLILVRKDLWQQVPFREQGILGVDWDFYRRVQALKEPILLMQGLYLYHWYRGGNQDATQHLL